MCLHSPFFLEEATFLVIQLVRGIAKYESIVESNGELVQARSYTRKLWNFALLPGVI